jgi:hypothetical protein
LIPVFMIKPWDSCSIAESTGMKLLKVGKRMVKSEVASS